MPWYRVFVSQTLSRSQSRNGGLTLGNPTRTLAFKHVSLIRLAIVANCASLQPRCVCAIYFHNSPTAASLWNAINAAVATTYQIEVSVVELSPGIKLARREKSIAFCANEEEVEVEVECGLLELELSKCPLTACRRRAPVFESLILDVDLVLVAKLRIPDVRCLELVLSTFPCFLHPKQQNLSLQCPIVVVKDRKLGTSGLGRCQFEIRADERDARPEAID